MASIHRETIQKQIQQDWANREYIEVITGSIKKITDFLNSFVRCNVADMSCRSRLAVLNEKLTTLERRVEYLEARVSIKPREEVFTRPRFEPPVHFGVVCSSDFLLNVSMWVSEHNSCERCQNEDQESSDIDVVTSNKTVVIQITSATAFPLSYVCH
uniref:Uncharacterized protein n=1 Tax=Timema shepardi TaxID=629360 RepID=A0A7R9G626_TIMSH|nr:unnamed protein product [Timema shepardi]